MPYNFAVGTGSFEQLHPDSAFWVFNRVANFAYLRDGDMIEDWLKQAATAAPAGIGGGDAIARG